MALPRESPTLRTTWLTLIALVVSSAGVAREDDAGYRRGEGYDSEPEHGRRDEQFDDVRSSGGEDHETDEHHGGTGRQGQWGAPLVARWRQGGQCVRDSSLDGLTVVGRTLHD